MKRERERGIVKKMASGVNNGKVMELRTVVANNEQRFKSRWWLRTTKTQFRPIRLLQTMTELFEVLIIMAAVEMDVVENDGDTKREKIRIKKIKIKSFKRSFSDVVRSAYFGPGGENPELYFSAVSSSLLKVALNRLFGQREGIIIKASKEQIKATTHREEGAPYYNSRATKIAMVTNGEGYFDMACPHLSSSKFGGGKSHQQQRRSSGPSYQKVSGHLSCGVVFIVPPGRPIITIASKNQNLQIVCFDVNALNNEKFPLAGLLATFFGLKLS
ncbi:Sucrose-binding protein [Camellia lanceoleosa]|uniref:Sucrose-binding protein n=1 Tax=Camellia lanceoleosa TaxID=1840588 RepID=A0ACC0GHX2_9ERIC|nr:Sucrose-binding protein [Camellia lanceoleosa]